MATVTLQNPVPSGMMCAGTLYPTCYPQKGKMITVRDPHDDTRDLMAEILGQRIISSRTPPHINGKPHKPVHFRVPPKKEKNKQKKKVNKFVQKEQIKHMKPSAPEGPVATHQSSSAQNLVTSIIGGQLCEPVIPTWPKWRRNVKAPPPLIAKPAKKAYLDATSSVSNVHDEAVQEITTSLFEQVHFRVSPKKEQNKKKIYKVVQKGQMGNPPPGKPSAYGEPVTTLRSAPEWKKCNTSISRDHSGEPVSHTRSKWRRVVKAPPPPRAKPPKKADPDTDPTSPINSVQKEVVQEIISSIFDDITVDSLTPIHSCDDLVEAHTAPETELKSVQIKEKPHGQVHFRVPQRKEDYKKKFKKVVQKVQTKPVKPLAPEESVPTPRPSSAEKRVSFIIGGQLYEPGTPTRPKWSNIVKDPLPPRARPHKMASPAPTSSMNIVQDKAVQEISTSHFEQVSFGVPPKKEKYKKDKKANKLVQKEQMEPVKPSAPEEPVTTLQSSSAQKRNTSIISDQPCKPVTPTRPKWSDIVKAPLPPRSKPRKKAYPDATTSVNNLQEEADQELTTSISSDISDYSLTPRHPKRSDTVKTSPPLIPTPPKKADPDTFSMSSLNSLQDKEVHTAPEMELKSEQGKEKPHEQVWQMAKRKRRKKDAIIVP